jgi:dethiobiotin synthetase
MTGLFFTATDTGVGKTTVAAAVARELRRLGHSVRVCKPVATGARWAAGRWVSDDSVILADAAGMAGRESEVTPWAFPEPVAPPVAANRHGVVLNVASLAGAVSRQAHNGSAMLVEGVGGLLCPLTERETVADLAVELALPLIVVARRSLGTLNHTLLTLEVARRRDLHVAGVVVNETEYPEGLAAATNVEELRCRICVPLLAVVPYQERAGGVLNPVPALTAVDWWRLCKSPCTLRP